MNETNKPFESWAVVELFGHTQIAGLVTEATIAGGAFIRVDVPAINGRPEFTKLYGPSAIYSITPTGEEEARIALAHIMPRPVSVYLLPSNSTPRTGDPDKINRPDSEEGDDEEDSDDRRHRILRDDPEY